MKHIAVTLGADALVRLLITAGEGHTGTSAASAFGKSDILTQKLVFIKSLKGIKQQTGNCRKRRSLNSTSVKRDYPQ